MPQQGEAGIMAKTTAPLLSFGASGQVAKTQVYSKWKGRSYVRRHVVPANPQTAAQSLTRNTFTWLQQVYKFAPSLFTAPWAAYAVGKVLTDRNAFSKFNIAVLRAETDLNNFVWSPGSLGGIAPASVSAAAGVGEIDVTITAPADIPTGWTITRAVAACIADQDPQTEVLFTMVAGEDLTSAYVVNLPGLDTVLYQVGGWLQWERPDGRVAYSVALTDTATPT